MIADVLKALLAQTSLEGVLQVGVLGLLVAMTVSLRAIPVGLKALQKQSDENIQVALAKLEEIRATGEETHKMHAEARDPERPGALLWWGLEAYAIHKTLTEHVAAEHVWQTEAKVLLDKIGEHARRVDELGCAHTRGEG